MADLFNFDGSDDIVTNPLGYNALAKSMQVSSDVFGGGQDGSSLMSYGMGSSSPMQNYFAQNLGFSSEKPLTNENAQNRVQQGKEDTNHLMNAFKAVQGIYEPRGGIAIGGSEDVRVKSDVYGRPYTTVRIAPEEHIETIPFGITEESKKSAAVKNEAAKASEAQARAVRSSMAVQDVKDQRKAMGFNPETGEYNPQEDATDIDVQSGGFMKGIAAGKAKERGQESINAQIINASKEFAGGVVTPEERKTATQSALAQNYYNAAAKGIGNGRVAMGKYGYAQTTNSPSTLEANTFLQREAKKRASNM
jgi:hypothetical protein